MSQIKFQLDWDLAKSNSIFSKHRIRFAESLAVFDDPLAVTHPNVEHGRAEERWITIGQADARLLAVHLVAPPYGRRASAIRKRQVPHRGGNHEQ